MAGNAPFHTPMRRYEERDDAPEPALDRLFDEAMRALRAVRARRDSPARLAAAVAERAVAYATGDGMQRVRDLRYRLRRGGLTPPLIVECCACFTALGGPLGLRFSAEALHGARAMLSGCIAGVASAGTRRDALAMAAWSQALAGGPVHLLTGDDAQAQALAGFLQPFARAGGLAVSTIAAADEVSARRTAYAADIVCVSAREAGHDYLRDRLALGARGHTLPGLVERLAASPAARSEPLLPGLRAAIVADADVLMIDEAQMPLMLAADVQQPEARLRYEQALEFARTLSCGAHYGLGPSGVRLTAAGRARLERLVAPLGGAWRAQQGREALIEAALDALHCLARDRDYRVVQGQVQFPPADPEESADEAEARALRSRLVEIKEGCRLAVRREIRSRLPLPRFLRRYLRLAGAAADVSGLGREFRSLYRLGTIVCEAAPNDAGPVRLFRDAAPRDAALIEAVHSALRDHGLPVVAVRTRRQAETVVAVLSDAGVTAVTGSAAAMPVPKRGEALVLLYPGHRRVEPQGLGCVHLIVAELHDAARHVQQLRRTYAPAACTMLLSLDDELFSAAMGPLLPALSLRYRGTPELPAGDARRLYRHGQRNCEKAYAAARAELISRDRQLSDLLAFGGQRD